MEEHGHAQLLIGHADQVDLTDLDLAYLLIFGDHPDLPALSVPAGTIAPRD